MKWTGRHWITGDTVVITCTEDGRIKRMESSDQRSNVWIGPGLIDIQVNGAGGFNLNDIAARPITALGVLNTLRTYGITRFCPTVITGTKDRMLNSIHAITRACEIDGFMEYSTIGIHVEGPFISVDDGPRGAHNRDWVRDPNWDEFLEWKRVSNGRIKKVTLAPEKPGAIEFIKRLVDCGVIAAIGHSSATEEEIQRAIEAGATLSTHLGNGAHPYIKRHPNYIWAQLAADSMWAGLIPDGFHLPPSTLKVMVRTKGRKAILTSDASQLCGMLPGRYKTYDNGEVVLEPSGLLHLAHTHDILAGSATPLYVGISNMVKFGISNLGEAINMASLHAAELFDIAHQGVGTLCEGGPADVMIYNADEIESGGPIKILKTICKGQIVYSDADA
ncbi:amidohydrolase family protein [Alicyclobacillus fastidiosus]|uniref:Amidohydrolase family protein n=1 Tax=Alicyclobacillus fastidiosus TaxID=392011 RepID=A0ABY6ZNN2_9BACL|nr:amidohydrolase family protein [Alicyclobacillus fastidiosus]WAH44588.1 amidohydrolase family protein [Alicyclobacillus fastidiosus]